MKVFIVAAERGFLGRGGGFSVLLYGPDKVAKQEFEQTCRATMNRMKAKYRVGGEQEERKLEKEIIRELARKVGRSLGLKILKVAGKYSLRINA